MARDCVPSIVCNELSRAKIVARGRPLIALCGNPKKYPSIAGALKNGTEFMDMGTEETMLVKQASGPQAAFRDYVCRKDTLFLRATGLDGGI